MLFVKIGAVVRPRMLDQRQYKGVITGIIDNTFVVIKKQDMTSEIIRLKDVVLTEEIINIKDLEDVNHKFYEIEAEEKQNDFERFQENLRKRIADEIVKSKGI